MKPWKIYVYGTIIYIKPDFITDFIDILNNLYESTKFTYEVDHNGMIPLLDVILIKKVTITVRNNRFSKIK